MEGETARSPVQPVDDGNKAVAPRGKKRGRVLSTALLIVGVIFVLIGAAMAVTSVTISEPVIPAGTPPEVTSMQALDDPAGLTANGIIAYQNEPYGFDVFFGEANVDPPTEPGATPLLQSIDGDWYGTDAHVSVDDADRSRPSRARTGASRCPTTRSGRSPLRCTCRCRSARPTCISRWSSWPR